MYTINKWGYTSILAGIFVTVWAFFTALILSHERWLLAPALATFSILITYCVAVMISDLKEDATRRAKIHDR